MCVSVCFLLYNSSNIQTFIECVYVIFFYSFFCFFLFVRFLKKKHWHKHTNMQSNWKRFIRLLIRVEDVGESVWCMGVCVCVRVLFSSLVFYMCVRFVRTRWIAISNLCTHIDRTHTHTPFVWLKCFLVQALFNPLGTPANIFYPIRFIKVHTYIMYKRHPSIEQSRRHGKTEHNWTEQHTAENIAGNQKKKKIQTGHNERKKKEEDKQSWYNFCTRFQFFALFDFLSLLFFFPAYILCRLRS